MLDRDYETLGGMAERARTFGVVVEIGSYQGAGLSVLTKYHDEVYGIDPWGLDPAFDDNNGYYAERQIRYGFQNMAIARRHAPEAHLIRGFSVEVAAQWTLPVSLLFIDGTHTYDAVHADWKAWKKHLSKRAYVAFDDYKDLHPEVIEAVDDIAKYGNYQLQVASEMAWIVAI